MACWTLEFHLTSPNHQQNSQCGLGALSVMNECDNMRALLATWASSLLTGQPSAGLVTRAGHHLSNSILMDFLYPQQ